MANTQLLGSDKIIRLGNEAVMGLVQSVDWAPAFNAEDIFELGQEAKVGTTTELETSGSMELRSIGGTPGLLARMLVSRAAGAFDGYVYDADGAGGKNQYTIGQEAFREAEFDLIIHHQTDGATFDRSVVLPRCVPSGISGRADSQGSASETLNFAGDFVIGLPSPYHDVLAVPCTRTDAATIQMINSDGTDITGFLNVDWNIAYVYVDEIRIKDISAGEAIDAAFSATDGEIVLTGITVPTGAICRAIVYKSTGATTFPALLTADRTTTAQTVNGWQADVFLVPTDIDNPAGGEEWLKVQSIDWNIDLRTEPLRQVKKNLAGTAIFQRYSTFPLNVSANITVTESDWADWKAVLDATEKPMGDTGTDVYGESYDFAAASLNPSFGIAVRYYTKDGTTLQTWKFQDMRVDSYGARSNVGGRSEISWGLQGTTFELVGANA